MSRPFINRNTVSRAPGVRLRSVSDAGGQPLPTAQEQATVGAAFSVPVVHKTAPMPSFSASPASGVAPLTVQFTDTSEGAPVAWSWDFQADGVVESHERHPTFTYTVPGVYSVRMAATDAEGGIGFVTRREVVVVRAPT